MSLIPKFLTAAGREEVARASNEARALENQLETERHSLSGKQVRRLERRLDEVRGITRRNLLEKLICGAGIVGGGTAGISFLTENKEGEELHSAVTTKEPDQPETPNTTGSIQEVSEEELQSIIERIELGMSEWETVIREKVEKNGGLPSYLKENYFWKPFEMIKLNSQNKSKNARALLRQAPESGSMHLEDVRYFSYDALENFSEGETNTLVTNMSAFFVPIRRRIYLDSEIDPENPSDLLTIYHETIHAAQDLYMRSTMSRDAYFNQVEVKPGEPVSLDIRFELDAYAMELELADILLDGKLRDGTIKTDEIFEKLRANSPVKLQYLQVLHDVAKLYFPLGTSAGGYPNAFYNELVQMYANQGYEIYLSNEKGELRRIK